MKNKVVTVSTWCVLIFEYLMNETHKLNGSLIKINNSGQMNANIE